MSNNLAYSLIFKIVDGATAKIREIANVMAEPTAAVAALGDASEASSVRQVSAFAKASAAVNDFTDTMAKPIAKMAAMGRAAGEAADKVTHSMGAMGVMIAEGFSLKEVADDQEFWLKFQTNASMGKKSMEELRAAIDQTADHYGVARTKMMEALEAYRNMGGNPAAFGAQADNIGIAVKGAGMDPGSAGLELATLAKLGITDPKEVVSLLSQMNAQLGGVPERMNAAADASGRLISDMQSLQLSGTQGALALNAVYAVAARSSGGNARVARSQTDGWLDQLADRGYQNQLSQGLGQRITDRNGKVMDPRIIMQMMAEKYAEAMKLPDNQRVVSLQRLDGMFGENASKMFRSVGGEIKATGHSKTMDDVLGAKSDPAALMNKAEKASSGLESAMERLRNAMKKASESAFAGPIDDLASALNHCNSVVAWLVIGLAALVFIGTLLNWIVTTTKNVKLLGAAMGLFKVETEGATAASEAQAAVSSGSWISGLVGGLRMATAATWEWTLALLANPITWIVLAIVAAIAAIGLVIYIFATHWKQIWATMPKPVQHLLTFIEGGFEWVSKKLGINKDGRSDLGRLDIDQACRGGGVRLDLRQAGLDLGQAGSGSRLGGKHPGHFVARSARRHWNEWRRGRWIGVQRIGRRYRAGWRDRIGPRQRAWVAIGYSRLLARPAHVRGSGARNNRRDHGREPRRSQCDERHRRDGHRPVAG